MAIVSASVFTSTSSSFGLSAGKALASRDNSSNDITGTPLPLNIAGFAMKNEKPFKKLCRNYKIRYAVKKVPTYAEKLRKYNIKMEKD